MTDRRDFLKTLGAAALTAGVAPRLLAEPPRTAPYTDPAVEELALYALQAAKDAGASYADVRFGRYRRQSVSTRERQVTGVSDSESFGCGIRTLVDGAWGFASTADVSKESLRKTAAESVTTARAAKRVQRRPVVLAPVTPAKGAWKTPVKVDPIDVPIEDKVALLLAANEAALKVKGVRFASTSVSALREEKTLATTDGTLVTQTFYRVAPTFTATAIGSGGFETYNEELAPRGSGWEYVTSLDMANAAERWAARAAEKLTARSLEPGRYDVVLDPRNLWLTIHESVGHALELDRALGYEANYAGTSFVAPPEKVLGKLRFGSELMTIRADRTQEGALARVMWDDEGVPAEEWTLIDKGIVKDYQTTREQAAWISALTGVKRSHGCAFAQSWSDVPFQRMPNVSLLPNTKDVSLDDIVSATDRGVMFTNRATYSIDHQRYNFQFGGQAAWEIRGGKVVGMVKDCAYQATTTTFWNALDMLGGRSTYFLGGTFNDGKGEPGQSNQVSHGCPAARFKNINVIATGGAA
ncbi:peptidase U62 modulator of DNA gyrase [Gemmatirosa kalamazoonensis]|uniref:Peptidase U62 modulator of DNA gyrase n=1 Tax=Gemmatirosa kalamazoonensis TaxID=861299 RepID=W0RD88_9BACT|nr:TldD/PmbA family protein [Gemmatirosa kalamazoonensis]AHG88741.1 peptidase U62 modulator of DNA gyrase [Gemmatirosa kalamazoonensis]